MSAARPVAPSGDAIVKQGRSSTQPRSGRGAAGLAAAIAVSSLIAAPVSTCQTSVASPSGFYHTNFPLTENPMREGGVWIEGGTDNLDFSDVSTTPGLAIGHETIGNGHDAIAILDPAKVGSFPADQYAEGVVYWSKPLVAYSPEIELFVRTTFSAHWFRGYSCSFGVNASNQPYLLIGGAYGSFGDWQSIMDDTNAKYAVVTGDVIRLQIVGTRISVYKNAALMNTADVATAGRTTDILTGGSAGLGFNSEEAGGTHNNLYGLSAFTAGGMGSTN